MVSAWATHYIGVPYAPKGREAATGLDCWGLVRVVYHEQKQVELPSYAEDYATSYDAKEIGALVSLESDTKWLAVASGSERPYDVVVLRVLGHPMHCGVCVGDRQFIHCLKGTNVVMEGLDDALWCRRVVGFFRYKGA